MHIGSKLAAARKAQNLTQEQLAERLGVSRQAVSRWESNTSYPETDKIVRMARILGVSCDYLLREDITEDTASPLPPEPATRLLRQAVGRRVKLDFYELEYAFLDMDNCVIRSLDGMWAEVEINKAKKETVSKLIPISAIQSITFLPEKQDGKEG